MELQGSDVILQCTALRGMGRFDEAISLVEKAIGTIHPDITMNAWLEAFYAAKEKGDIELTKRYAQKVAGEDPLVPSIQPFL